MLVSCSQCKPLNLRHPRRQTLKFVSPRCQTLKFALPPTPTPDSSQRNIGGVGPSGVGAGVGHVHFMFFVLISFAFCSQRKPSFQWNMGFRQTALLTGPRARMFQRILLRCNTQSPNPTTRNHHQRVGLKWTVLLRTRSGFRSNL